MALKISIPLLSLFTFVPLQISGQSVVTEYTRIDRLTHMGAGYVIAGTTTAVAYNFTEKDWQAELIGLVAVIAIAGAKPGAEVKKQN